MSRKVVIIGAGGHAKVVADIVLCCGDEVVGFLDDDSSKLGKKVYKNYEVLGVLHDYVRYEDCEFVIAVGDNYTRERIKNKMSVNWYTAIHPSAVVADTVKIGVGTVVMAGAIINSDAVIGNHCIINTGVTVDHDNVVEDYVHISPGAHLAGNVKVGEHSWVCIGASVINDVTICRDVIVGAGATVVKDISESGTYVSTPARRIK